jgi:hypothetical protein
MNVVLKGVTAVQMLTALLLVAMGLLMLVKRVMAIAPRLAMTQIRARMMSLRAPWMLAAPHVHQLRLPNASLSRMVAAPRVARLATTLIVSPNVAMAF